MYQWSWLRIRGIAAVGIMLSLSACGERSKPTRQNDNLASAAVSKPLHAPNPSKTAPPSATFAGYERIDTRKFYSTQQFTVINTTEFPGAVDEVSYDYVYADGRFSAIHSNNADVVLTIVKFSSPDLAKAYLDSQTGKAIPIANADTVSLPKCSGEKRDNDNFIGPNKIVKQLHEKERYDITVLQPGDFNMGDCSRGHNPEEKAVWADGQYYFVSDAIAMNGKDSPQGRAEELAVDYAAALGSHH
jgi:hypothetical protein